MRRSDKAKRLAALAACTFAFALLLRAMTTDDPPLSPEVVEAAIDDGLAASSQFCIVPEYTGADDYLADHNLQTRLDIYVAELEILLVFLPPDADPSYLHLRGATPRYLSAVQGCFDPGEVRVDLLPRAFASETDAVESPDYFELVVEPLVEQLSGD